MFPPLRTAKALEGGQYAMTHTILKFSPVFWIRPWAPAEVGGSVEESCSAQILQGGQETPARSAQTPLCAERSSHSHPSCPCTCGVLLFLSLDPKPAMFL